MSDTVGEAQQIWRSPKTRTGLQTMVNLVREADQWPDDALTGIAVFIPHTADRQVCVALTVDTTAAQAASVLGWLNEVSLEREMELTLDQLIQATYYDHLYDFFSGPTELVVLGLETALAAL